MDEVEAYRRERRSIDGWLSDVDFDLLVAVDAAQRESGVEGDLFEIGAYLGASAILLGLLCRPGEVLHVCDLFEQPPEGDSNAYESATYYSDLTRRGFESNYGRFHQQLPVIHQRSSTTLEELGLPAGFRLVHVDGCHAHEVVRADIETSRALAGPGAIVVFDDYRREGLPGVAAGVWEAVSNAGLLPLAASPGKLYCTWDAGNTGLRSAFATAVRRAGHPVDTQPVFDAEVLCVGAKPVAPTLRRFVPPVVLELRRQLLARRR